MRELPANDVFFAEVHKGLAWAAADLPAGRIENGLIRAGNVPVRLLMDKTLAGTDGFSLGRDDQRS